MGGSGLDWVTGFDPGIQAAKDGVGLITIGLKEQRRTGAGFFGRSGAVCDNLEAGVKLCDPGFELVQRNGQCTGDAMRFVVLGAAHIEDDGLSGLNCGMALFSGQASDAVIGCCVWWCGRGLAYCQPDTGPSQDKDTGCNQYERQEGFIC